MSLPVEETALAVVGAGPAGLCAALEAARAGMPAVVIDENESAGGQLFKQVHRFFGSRRHGAGRRGFEIAGQLVGECIKDGVEIRLSSAVLGFFRGGELMVDSPRGAYLLRPLATVIATGASERSVAFPGWTLPGIMGAGAAQTLVNIHGVLPGRRVLMAGAGDVGVIVGYQLLQAGAEVVGIIDVADQVSGYEVHLDRLSREGVPVYTGHRILRAEGGNSVEAVLAEDVHGGRIFRFRVDSLCMALGLSPLAELASMRGCRMVYQVELGGFLPWHDIDMHTDQTGVYVAGDAAGVEEASVAMEEGRLSGISAAEDLEYLTGRRAAARKREIRLRLGALRAGPYGAGKLAAKQSMYRA